mmetsp:Transcript_21224/g.67176  ORF Transcript_21224/g.67176 Transcript_21224/m.67176 type:complete len:246 (+) Transcript_21224:271-1008(+)
MRMRARPPPRGAAAGGERGTGSEQGSMAAGAAACLATAALRDPQRGQHAPREHGHVLPRKVPLGPLHLVRHSEECPQLLRRGAFAEERHACEGLERARAIHAGAVALECLRDLAHHGGPIPPGLLLPLLACRLDFVSAEQVERCLDVGGFQRARHATRRCDVIAGPAAGASAIAAPHRLLHCSNTVLQLHFGWRMVRDLVKFEEDVEAAQHRDCELTCATQATAAPSPGKPRQTQGCHKHNAVRV